MNPVARLGLAEVRILATRRWYLGIVAAGIAGAVLVAVMAAGEAAGSARVDAIRSGSASVLLLCGLVLALVLGATAFWPDIRSGRFGLFAATGVSRATIVISRVAARLAGLGLGMVVWIAALQAGSAALGEGYDAPLSVHGLAAFVTLSLTLVAAAATSTVLGAAVSAVAGLAMYISAQAVVNLEAAADVGRMGSATRLVHVAYNILPRAILSPVIVEMQNRDAAGPAAPQFEINDVPVPLVSSSWGTVVWTVAWCGLLTWLCYAGMRRRTIN